MKMTLTTSLLQFLIQGGYKYCLSQTCAIGQDEDAFTSITLKPVKKNPLLKKLPELFEMYYNLIREPSEMASGKLGFLIRVKLTKKDHLGYISTH
ncbi:MAG: hypothetical protein ACRYFA_00625 [Janthinobacterium lividum]